MKGRAASEQWIEIGVEDIRQGQDLGLRYLYDRPQPDSKLRVRGYHSLSSAASNRAGVCPVTLQAYPSYG